MQIKNLVLYKNSNFEPKVIDFELGKVNIITGESSTGKTAIIDIVDYCLGSKSFSVKGDVIRKNVAWFAMTIQFDREQIFIARQNPVMLNLKSTKHLYYINADEINIPDFDQLKNNSNITALNNLVSNKLNFSDNINDENNTRDEIEATFRHSRIFSFQPQNVIAEFKYLFFNQDESFVELAIKDTIPYILGAINEDDLLLKQKISAMKRELRKLQRELNNRKLIENRGNTQVGLLINESKEVGLLDINLGIKSEKEAIEILTNLSKNDNFQNESSAENELLSSFIDEKKQLRTEKTKITHEINAILDYSQNTNGFKDEVSSQHDRLLSLELFKEPKSKEYWNSLVGTETHSIIPSIKNLNSSLITLRNKLQFVNQEKPKMQRFVAELRDKENDIQNQIDTIVANIKNIYRQNDELDRIKNINIKKGKILGRVSLFLESYEITEESNLLKTKIDTLNDDINALEVNVSSDEKENKLNAILNKINIIMSSWSDKLSWEYKNYNLRFDPKKLTLFADSDEKSESLQQMGSGENWLACHLFIHLALHKHFIDKKRPVPNFIIFDQPTQVHYPNGYNNINGTIATSEDEIADKKMFHFLFEVTKQLAPNLQVIITDHADFENDEFQEAVVAKWKNGEKLVPLEWL